MNPVDAVAPFTTWMQNTTTEVAIEALILACLLMLFRIAAFIMFLPPFNGQGLPNIVKIGLSVALVFVLAPRYAPQVALILDGTKTSDGAWMQLAYLGIRETALGAGLAWLFGLCLVPVRIAGAWVAQEMGLTMAGLTSPMDQQASNVISQALEAIAVLMFFVLDVHHVMFMMLGQSFEMRPVASRWGMPSWDSVLWSVNLSVDHGFLVIAPIGILLFVVSLTLLITMRVAPQFNFMSWGMALRLFAGIGSLVVFFPEICGAVQHLLTYVGREVMS
jgi:flagellar biosynthesis protein FliR